MRNIQTQQIKTVKYNEQSKSLCTPLLKLIHMVPLILLRTYRTLQKIELLTFEVLPSEVTACECLCQSILHVFFACLSM